VNPELLNLSFDLAGTVAFAVYGALSAIRYTRLDLVGVLVLGTVTAIGGGAMRDAILGATPVNAVADWRYPVAALAGAFVTFLAAKLLDRIENTIVVFDALGLGFFAVSGASKALDYGATSVGAVFLGVLTAVGGGVVRDVLIRRVPSVLYADLYATSALVGALIVVVGVKLGWAGVVPSTIAVLVAVAIRLAALRWNLSAPGVPGGSRFAQGGDDKPGPSA